MKNLPPIVKMSLNLGLATLFSSGFKIFSFHTGNNIFDILSLLSFLFFSLVAGYFFIVRIYGEKEVRDFLFNSKDEESDEK